jgi:trans-2,3-dihydro-3-hydroxyanthranilate isomerase
MHALVVDAFATEPMTGQPVTVLPDADLTDDQIRAVAGELGTVGALVSGSDELRYVAVDHRTAVTGARNGGERGAVAGAVAAAALFERDRLDAGTHGVATDDANRPVTIDPGGETTVDLPAPEHHESTVSTSRIAGALGIDAATIRDVGADLPPARVAAGREFLAVPVNFFEHLGNADPNPAAVGDLLATADASAVYAFTFDTLSTGATWSARVFTPDGERPVSARGAVAAGAYARRHGAFDLDRTEFVATSGQFLDRPSRVSVDLSGTAEGTAANEWRAGGSTVTVLDGSVTEPPDPDDDILEA